MIKHTIEIARPPQEVFGYLDDLERHGEWQDDIVSSRLETDGPTRVGSRAVDVRKMGGSQREVAYEIVEHDPPRRFAFRGINGPVRPHGIGTVEALGDGASSRVTIELDLKGHGLGVLIAPLARRQAAKQIPHTQEKLKERLESGAASHSGS
jgi:uncharacterized membrane protein